MNFARETQRDFGFTSSLRISPDNISHCFDTPHGRVIVPIWLFLDDGPFLPSLRARKKTIPEIAGTLQVPLLWLLL